MKILLLTAKLPLEALVLQKLQFSSSTAALAAGAVLLVIIASCQSYNTPLVMESDGSYLRLPDNSTKALVWGTEPEAVKSLKTWLLKQRIPLIDDVKLSQLAGEMGLHNHILPPDVLKLAKTLGAKQVILVPFRLLTTTLYQALPLTLVGHRRMTPLCGEPRKGPTNKARRNRRQPLVAGCHQNSPYHS